MAIISPPRRARKAVKVWSIESATKVSGVQREVGDCHLFHIRSKIPASRILVRLSRKNKEKNLDAVEMALWKGLYSGKALYKNLIN